MDHVAPKLDDYRLYSIVAGRRCKRVTALDAVLFRVRYPIERLLKDTIPQPAKDFVRSLFSGGAKG